MPEKSSPVAPVQNFVHTPGPWESKRLIDNTGKPYATLYECHIDLGPCMIWAPPGDKEQEANARLISAAPDLLAACQAALEEVQFFSHGTVKQLADAISKATEQVV